MQCEEKAWIRIQIRFQWPSGFGFDEYGSETLVLIIT